MQNNKLAIRKDSNIMPRDDRNIHPKFKFQDSGKEASYQPSKVSRYNPFKRISKAKEDVEKGGDKLVSHGHHPNYEYLSKLIQQTQSTRETMPREDYTSKRLPNISSLGSVETGSGLTSLIDIMNINNSKLESKKSVGNSGFDNLINQMNVMTIKDIGTDGVQDILERMSSLQLSAGDASWKTQSPIVKHVLDNIEYYKGRLPALKERFKKEFASGYEQYVGDMIKHYLQLGMYSRDDSQIEQKLGKKSLARLPKLELEAISFNPESSQQEIDNAIDKYTKIQLAIQFGDDPAGQKAALLSFNDYYNKSKTHSDLFRSIAKEKLSATESLTKPQGILEHGIKLMTCSLGLELTESPNAIDRTHIDDTIQQINLLTSLIGKDVTEYLNDFKLAFK